MKNWSRVIQGILIQARSDYIVGKDQLRFKMVGIRGISNFLSDHFTLRAKLLICSIEAGHQCNAGGLSAQMVNVHGGGEETGS